MATPYEFVANELLIQLPHARLTPLLAPTDASRRSQVERHYYSGIEGEPGNDCTRYSLHYPGGYPTYYPSQLTQPGCEPVAVRIALGVDALQTFTRPDSEIRQYLAQYGYWRIETNVTPATADFWLLLLPTEKATQYLILPTSKLHALLNRSHNPEKFSLLLAKDAFCFAAQPLTSASRLAILQNPSLLDTAEYRDLRLDGYLNNWQLLASC